MQTFQSKTSEIEKNNLNITNVKLEALLLVVTEHYLLYVDKIPPLSDVQFTIPKIIV